MNLIHKPRHLVPFETMLELTNSDWPELLELMGSDANRGTNEFADVITQSADGASLNDMWREFQRVLSMRNSWRSPFLNLFTFQVTSPTERVLLPQEDDFEEATEFGEPVGKRLGAPFIAGYGFRWYDIAIRYTWLFLAESSAEQIRAIHSETLEADTRLLYTKIMRQIFNNTNSSALINNQNVNVYTFWNNDGIQTPPPYKGTTFASSHNHYVTSGAATIDAGDLTTMEDLLYEHGYRSVMGYDLVLYVNRQEGKVIRTFVAGAGSPVSAYSFIPLPAVGGGVAIPVNSGIVGRPTNTTSLPGAIGTWGPFLIVEEDYIPAGYMLAIASGGEQNIGNPIGFREHAVPSLRGLRLMPGPGRDYPLTDSFYQRGFGTGVRHRGAAAIMQITASGTYTIPPAYV
jgi:hypothetical protein